jgi:hypothetical protein
MREAHVAAEPRGGAGAAAALPYTREPSVGSRACESARAAADLEGP